MKEKREHPLQLDIRSRTCPTRAGHSKMTKPIKTGLMLWSTTTKKRSWCSMEGKVRTGLLVISQMKISSY
jgi:hypothetical protein